MIRPECYPIEIFDDKLKLRNKRCTICGQIPRDLVIDNKQRYYGERCFTAAIMMQYFKTTGIPSVCSQDVTLLVQQELDQAIVNCDQHTDCDWRGRLDMYNAHVKQEDYQKSAAISSTQKHANFSMKLGTRTFASLEKGNIDEEDEDQDIGISPLNKRRSHPEGLQLEIDKITKEMLDLIPAEHKNHFELLLKRFLTLTKIGLLPSNISLTKRVKYATNLQEAHDDDISDQAGLGSTLDKRKQLITDPSSNKQKFAEFMTEKVKNFLSNNQFTQNGLISLQKMILDNQNIVQNLQDSADGFQSKRNQLPRIGWDLVKCFRTRNTFSKALKSPIVSITDKGIIASKYSGCKVKLMSHSLANFGSFKFFTVEAENFDHFDFGLCLKTSANENINGAFKGKIGYIIVNYRSFKDCSYFDHTKATVQHNQGPPMISTDCYFDFDARTRTLTFSDEYLFGKRTIADMEILENVDLRNVHLYFVKYTREDEWQINLTERSMDHGLSQDVEIEQYNELVVRTDDGSIVKISDEEMHGALLAHPIWAFQKYKFELKVGDGNFACIGIVQKSKMSTSNFIITFEAGYQKDCGVILLSNQGHLMHDNQSLADLTSDDFREKSGVFFDSGQSVVVKYNNDSKYVSFVNLTTNEKLIVPYSIGPEEISDFHAAVFMGPKFMYFKVGEPEKI